MISDKRLERIKRTLMKDKGKMATIKFSDDTELSVKGTDILDSITNLPNENEFIKAIKSKEIVSCSSYGGLIHILQQLIES
ncbi:hypothetical protein H9660_08765 [Clostridium sp. Sa3CUN1]|uniref:Uncharacterized protein n=1 Tax=Clostridium gallinarum TaxID=2762246 RepID=A0ABR8Q499_9CLOT|nr:hypothetical protein [Clostridium gallinarum]MBD7915237.1 hypothetical protein [Clostridium gallinarum]